ncbi:MAG: methionine--tRNA ligase [Candidatus Melainabacteria bacterium]|nr:methionine--tRNA ligase [Candidatus Melainabacteria bacterium]
MSADTHAPTPPFYLTTAIDYVNAAPHLGHAYEKVAADVVARFHRLLGQPVFFLTGTDEHGIKVEKTALQKGLAPKAYTDTMAPAFQTTWDLLGIVPDRFIRTTDADHYQVVAHLWNTLKAKGDIYKAAYTGNYCSGCETFLTERDLNERGECRIHLKTPEAVQEENYFFKLSAYRDAIRTHIEQNPNFILPAFRAQEVLQLLDEIEDISVSRSRQAVSWGIPVPDDDDQVIYVWIDALSNYLTGVGYQTNAALYERFWPANLHIIGKDILRFHAIYWPAMLLSANIPLPKTVFAHGFINLNDAKISKSIGNVVAPQDVMARFSLTTPDPIRYYLMSVTTFGQDGNFTEDDFKARINADLANNLGNLVNRSLNMTVKYFEGKVPTLPTAPELLYQNDTAYLHQLTQEFDALSAEEKNPWKDGYHFPTDPGGMPYLNSALRQHPHYLPSRLWDQFVDDVRFKYACYDFEFALFTTFTHLVSPVNLFIDQMAPWSLAKAGDTDALAHVLYSVLERIRQLAILLCPVIPSLSCNILCQLGYAAENRSGQLWINAQPVTWNHLYAPLPYSQTLQPTGPLLPRLDSELAGTAKKGT